MATQRGSRKVENDIGVVTMQANGARTVEQRNTGDGPARWQVQSKVGMGHFDLMGVSQLGVLI